MRFKMDLSDFKSCHDRVSRFVPAKSPMIELMSIYLTAEENSMYSESHGICLQATDNSIGIRLQVSDVDCDRSGKVLLPAEGLREIVAKADGKDIEFDMSEDSGQIKIKSGRAKWTLNTSGKTDAFPQQKEFESLEYHDIKGEDFSRLVKRTVYATDPPKKQDEKSSGHYALEGMLFEGTQTSVQFVATTGRSIAVQKVPATFNGTWEDPGKNDPQCVLQPRFCKEVIGIASDDDIISLAFPNRGSSQARIGGAVVTASMIGGRFPGWRLIFQSDSRRLSTVINAQWLISTLAQASLLQCEDSRAVSMGFTEGQLCCSIRNYKGDAETTLAVDWNHEKFGLEVDPKYLIEMFKSFDKDMRPKVSFNTSHTTIVIDTEDGFLGGVMPITIKKED